MIDEVSRIIWDKTRELKNRDGYFDGQNQVVKNEIRDIAVEVLRIARKEHVNSIIDRMVEMEWLSCNEFTVDEIKGYFK